MPNATTRGATRLRTDGPAVPRRSTGSAGADRIVRTEDVGESSAGTSSRPSGTSPTPEDTPFERTFASSRSANSPNILVLTSLMMLRPNCATLPVIESSVTMETLVPPSSAVAVATTVAEALP